jgi:S1-C subfamily serine protease
MKKLIILLVLTIPFICKGQSLGEDRIESLNKSVVRIIIDSKSCGTGFFISNDGWIATCKHVIDSAIARDPVTKKTKCTKDIFIEFKNGEKVRVTILKHLLDIEYPNSLNFDYSLLLVLSKPTTKFKPLKIGKWNNANEGDVVYTCGYPFGFEHRFISQGLLSTKWIERVTDTLDRNVAWFDLTMNKGNSGGPIIKLGKKADDDEVIGIATFILNPDANKAQKICQYLPHRGIDMSSDGISQNQLMTLLFKAISNNSIGVSGGISIDYLNQILIKYKISNNK